MAIMTDKKKIPFGQVCDSMKLIHNFLKDKGFSLKWQDDKFDEFTALCLLMLETDINVIDFTENGGINSDDARYKVGDKVVIKFGAKYYANENATEPSGIIQLPTTGFLLNNLMNNYYTVMDENNKAKLVTPLNPLKIALNASPLKTIMSTAGTVSTISGNKTTKNTLSILDKSSGSINKASDGKLYSGFVQGQIVFLRKEGVIPSFSDMLISENLMNILKAGEIAAKGVEFINDINSLSNSLNRNNSATNSCKQFKSDEEKKLNNYLNKTSEERKQRNEAAEAKLKQIKERSQAASQEKRLRALRFNKNGMFIKNLITDTVIFIPFRPDEVDESYSVSWASENTRGSSHQIYGYESTTIGSPSITFDFDVGALSYYLTNGKSLADSLNKESQNFEKGKVELQHENIIKGRTAKYDITEGATREDGIGLETKKAMFDIVANYLNALKALAYPSYTNGIVTPPSCYVSIAKNFRFIGIVTNVSITHKGPLYMDTIQEKSSLAEQQIYMNYTVTLSFNKIVNQDFSADDVEVKGDTWTGGIDNNV